MPLEATKVQNAEWLMVHLGEHIDRFADELAIPGVHGPSLFAHFSRVVQYGGDHEEFWVALDDGEPVGFANWNTLGLPHVAKVYMGFLHGWARSQEVSELLGSTYLAFGERHHAVWYVWEPSSPALVRLLERTLKPKGHVLTQTGIINCLSRLEAPSGP